LHPGDWSHDKKENDQSYDEKIDDGIYEEPIIECDSADSLSSSQR
jgi:hypothetical protein